MRYLLLLFLRKYIPVKNTRKLLESLSSDPIYNDEEELEKFLKHDVEKELAKAKKSSRTSLDGADVLSSEESDNGEVDLSQLGDIKTSFMQDDRGEKLKQVRTTQLRTFDGLQDSDTSLRSS